MAPELPEASKEVTVAIAHTAADYDAATAALNAGARKITHLFNAMPPFTHRIPGVVGAAVNSAQAIGVFDRVGSLDMGKQANAAVLDKSLELKAVFFNGMLM